MWWRDSERGGAWTWRALSGEPLSPVRESSSVASLSSLNVCGDPQGVRLATANFHDALQHWVTLGWCRKWRQGKGIHFAVQWTVVLAPPRPVYDPAADHQYKGSRGGTHNTATAFAKAAARAATAPAAIADVMADPMEPPMASTHFRIAMAVVWAQGAPTSFEVCVVVY